MTHPTDPLSAANGAISADAPHAPLTRNELRDIIDLSLWAGQLLLQNGADSERVETTVHHIGTALGCNWIDVCIADSALIISAISGNEFRTKTRRVVRVGAVNMSAVARINTISREAGAGQLNRFQMRRQLEALDTTPPVWPRWLTRVMVGLACAAFGRLFGGDSIIVVTTFIATLTGFFVRDRLLRHQFNPFLIIVGAAFSTTLVGAIAIRLGLGSQPGVSLAAGVLFLVPGVSLVNAVEDLLSGHTLMGLARGLNGAFISLGIALGITLALTLTGLNGIGPAIAASPPLWEQIIWTTIAATGFAILFNVPRNALFGAALCATTGAILRILLMRSDLGLISRIELATLAGAIVIGFMGQLLARRLRVPAMTFTVSGIIPMVPGTYAFGTMIGLLQVSGIEAANATPLLSQIATNVVMTALILTALATGIALPSLLFQRARPVV